MTVKRVLLILAVILYLISFIKIHAEEIELENAVVNRNSSRVIANIYLETAWVEHYSAYHFRKASEWFQKSYEETGDDNDKRQSEINQERSVEVKDLLRNRYPLAPILQGIYKHRDFYEDPHRLAARGLTEEAQQNIRQLSFSKGQIPLVLQFKGEIPTSIEGYIYGLWENRSPFLLISKDEFENTASNFYILDYIYVGKDDTDIHLYQCKIYENINNEKKMVSFVDGIGQNSKALVRSVYGYVTFFVLVFLFFIIGFYILENKKLNLQKLVLFSLLFLVGGGSGFGLSYASSFVLKDWSLPAGSIAYTIITFGIVSYLLILFLLYFILSKIEDPVVISEQKLFIPMYFSSFFSGLAVYLIYIFELFEEFYPGATEDRFDGLFIFFCFMVIGYLSGLLIRNILRFNSLTRIADLAIKYRKNEILQQLRSSISTRETKELNIELEELHGKTIELKANKNRFALGSILMIGFLLPVFPYVLEKILSSQSTNFPYIFSLGLVISLFVSFRLKQKAIELPQPIRLRKEEYEESPRDLIELEYRLNHPPYIENDNSEGKNLLLDSVHSVLNKCYKEEGGALLILGDKGFGKTRFCNELLLKDNVQAKNVVYFECMEPEETQGQLPFYPIIEGLKHKPEVGSILENRKISKALGKNAGKLSGALASIPFIGGLLQSFLETDMDDLLDESREKNIEAVLLKILLELSRKLITESKNDNSKLQTDKLVLVFEKSHLMDDKTSRLLKKFQISLQDDELTPEENHVAIILLAQEKTNVLADFLKNSNTKEEKVFYIRGLDFDGSFKLFTESLGFADTYDQKRIFSNLFHLLAESSKGSAYLAPRYLFQAIRHLLHTGKIQDIDEKNQRGFKIKSLNHIKDLPIPEEFILRFNKLWASLNQEEKEMLEIGSILGREFQGSLVAELLGKEEVSCLKIFSELNQFITEKEKDGIYFFHFKSGLFYQLIRKRATPTLIHGEFENNSNQLEQVSNQKALDKQNKDLESMSPWEWEKCTEYGLKAKIKKTEDIEFTIKAGLNYSEYLMDPNRQINFIPQAHLAASIIERIMKFTKYWEEVAEENTVYRLFLILSDVSQTLKDSLYSEYPDIGLYFNIKYPFPESHLLNRFSDNPYVQLAKLEYLYNYQFSLKASPMQEIAERIRQYCLDSAVSIKSSHETGDLLHVKAKFWEGSFYKLYKDSQSSNYRSLDEQILLFTDCKNSLEKKKTQLSKHKDQEIEIKNLLSRIYNTLGELYYYKSKSVPTDSMIQELLNTSKDHFLASMALKESLHDQLGLAIITSFLGSIYLDYSMLNINEKSVYLSKAKSYYEKSKELNLKLGSDFGKYISLQGILNVQLQDGTPIQENKKIFREILRMTEDSEDRKKLTEGIYKKLSDH